MGGGGVLNSVKRERWGGEGCCGGRMVGVGGGEQR